MPIEPVKIPQNVYIEDRIIGPITLRQIILLMIGGGISYALWTAMKNIGYNDILTTILCWVPLVITAAFAFIKINGIGLLRFLFLFYERTQKPQVRVWQLRTGIWISPEKIAQKSEVKRAQMSELTQQTDNINQLSSVLDTGPLPFSGERTRSATMIDTITAKALKENGAPQVVRDIRPSTPQHG